MRHPYQPDPDAALVVVAALGGPSHAQEAWRAWRALGHTVDDAAPEVVRLLPLVSRNVSADVLGEGDAGRLAGVVRRTWYLNQMRFAAVAPALRALGDRGLEPALLKGAAISVTVARGAALRPMIDVDVLVRREDVDAATDVLFDHGFVRRLPAPALRSVWHAEEFTSGDATIDLHWRPTHFPPPPGLRLALRETSLQDAPVLVPAPEDLVVLACIHGMGPVGASFQWLADVALLVREHELDWDAVVGRAVAAEATVAVGAALGVAAAHTPVPESALTALRSAGGSRGERTRHWMSTSAPRPRHLFEVWLVWALYEAGARRSGRRPTLRGFLDVLAQVAEVDTPLALPRHWVRTRLIEPRQRTSAPPSTSR